MEGLSSAASVPHNLASLYSGILMICPSRLAAVLCLILHATPAGAAGSQPFLVASYNLENYLLQPSGGRPTKTPESRAAVRDILRSIDADIIGLQEVGGREGFDTLRADLRSVGLVYPYSELAAGSDPHIAVALLSRFPISSRRSHTNESFLLMGRRFHVSRGFLEVEIQPSPDYRLTVFCVHLKSRRVVAAADESEIREQEAILLRERIDQAMRGRPGRNLLVMGDLNDTRDSRTLRALLGRGNAGLIDTRPSESTSGRGATDRRSHPRVVTWTHHYALEDTYSRIDYILINRGLFHEWLPERSGIPLLPLWGVASDHRPVTASFRIGDSGSRTQ